MTKCYMCDANGATKEHAPPDSFFPKGYRDKLWTVPSCDEHNSKNSKDVEYVRNVLVSHISTNNAAREHFQNKVRRSFENSPKLFNRTFADAKPILIGGEETGVYTFDLPRFKIVMEAIAHAIHFKMFGSTYSGSWAIFSPSLISQPTLFQSMPDGWEEFRQLVVQLTYTEILTPQPEIFRLGIHQWNEEQLIYAFVFYGGFMVNALALTPSTDAAQQFIQPERE